MLLEQVLGSGDTEGSDEAGHQERAGGLNPGGGGSRALGNGGLATLCHIAVIFIPGRLQTLLESLIGKNQSREGST